MMRRTLAALVAVVAALGAAAAIQAAGRWVTITSNHSVAEDGVPVLLAGMVASRRRGEVVTIEQDECGPAPWRPLRRVRTGNGGAWVSYATSDVGVRLRARWGRTVSRVIRVVARPEVDVAPSGRRLHVLVRAHVYFPGARVELQAFRSGRWRTTSTAPRAPRRRRPVRPERSRSHRSSRAWDVSRRAAEQVGGAVLRRRRERALDL
jgi:hypothetical protein